MIPTLKELRFKAREQKRAITATVLLADDRIERVTMGPRGGWRMEKPKRPRIDFENSCPICGPTCEC